MISRSNDNSYHDGTIPFFNVFSKKDLHLNAVEKTIIKDYQLCMFQILTHYENVLINDVIKMQCIGLCEEFHPNKQLTQEEKNKLQEQLVETILIVFVILV